METAKKEFMKRDAKLWQKKARLFEDGSTGAWNLDPEEGKAFTLEQLKQHKELAFPLMLPKVRLEIDKIRKRMR